MTNLILMRGVRFGFAERSELWFWRACERSGVRLRLNDNKRQPLVPLQGELF